MTAWGSSQEIQDKTTPLSKICLRSWAGFPWINSQQKQGWSRHGIQQMLKTIVFRIPLQRGKRGPTQQEVVRWTILSQVKTTESHHQDPLSTKLPNSGIKHPSKSNLQLLLSKQRAWSEAMWKHYPFPSITNQQYHPYFFHCYMCFYNSKSMCLLKNTLKIHTHTWPFGNMCDIKRLVTS